MKSEEKRIYYNINNQPFFSKKDAAKSNTAIRYEKLKRLHNVQSVLDKGSDPLKDGETKFVVGVIVGLALIDLIVEHPHIVEELLHEFYNDMGEDLKIKKEIK